MAEPARVAAYHAVECLALEWDQNEVSRHVIWRFVNAALDAFENELASTLYEDRRRGWLLTLDGKPIVVSPTRRIAKMQRKYHAHLSRRWLWEYRLQQTEVQEYAPMGSPLPATP